MSEANEAVNPAKANELPAESDSKAVLKSLVKELKQVGVNVGEDAAREVVKAVFRAAPKVVLATKNKYDDFLLPFFPLIEARLLPEIDKIDGKEG